MDKEYYYLNGDTKVGPFSLDALKSAPINPDTLVWNSSLPDWVAARTLPELQDVFAAAGNTSASSSNYDQREPKYNTHAASSTDYSTSGGTFGDPNMPKPPMPDNYLVWAILSTVLCCMPLGIVSIINSTKVSSAYALGDYVGADNASKNAKKWAMWSAIAAGVVWLLYVIFLIIIGVGAAMSSDV
ncbi:CD225/dispanin family protein [Tannerella sp.]|uniref:CD225/dispanin family protein n=1 Tax=Tannerella sp. TaxID=2382127 RepID=UPI0026DD0EF7|nr:CD225/dispanin family protein [Tannerella sp.]MDO4703461.1 CD225/dispanin family protein [Tannerella sp.]